MLHREHAPLQRLQSDRVCKVVESETSARLPVRLAPFQARQPA